MFGMMASAVGYGDSNPQQTPEEQEAEKMAQAKKEYVSITFLERQADIFVRWVLKRGNLLMSKQELVKHLLNSTNHSEEDIQLLVQHLKHSGRCAFEEIDDDVLFKFKQTATEDASVHSSTKESSQEISSKEKALFVLERAIKKIESKVQERTVKVDQCDQKIRELLAKNNKGSAVVHL